MPGNENYPYENGPDDQNPPPYDDPGWFKRHRVIVPVIVAIVVVIFFPKIFGSSDSLDPRPISDVIAMAQSAQISYIEVDGDSVVVITNDGMRYKSQKEEGASIVEMLERAGVDIATSKIDIVVREPSGSGVFLGILFNFLPIIFFGAVLWFMMRQMQGNASNTFKFGKSRARDQRGMNPKVIFDDVAGVDEAKEELEEIVYFLRFPGESKRLGAKIPKGVLLTGPPGTGKTLMARAVAGEANVPFFSMSGSEFVEMFVGVGASRVRDLFEKARRNAPCILFIDEIDAVGRHRGAGLGGGHDEREQTLNQILIEMDGFETNTNIIVIAATNRPDILDPALLRPGRFDRKVVLDNPDIRGRKQILEVHLKGKPLAEEVDLEIIARQTMGFSGAGIANLVNEAVLLATRRDKNEIEHEDFEDSIDKVIAGPERKSRVISDKEKEMTAYHEAGHAVVAHFIPDADPPYKVTIVSRGQSGGHTRYLPEEDRTLWTKKQFEAMLAAAVGGRVAEELIFKEVTTGAANDLKQATATALAMVTQYGMSEKLGLRTFGKREQMPFIGKEISEQRDYGEDMAGLIDEEIKALLDAARETAKDKLKEGKDALERLADYLIENETIEGDVLNNVLKGN